jgi:hypothetical protein
VNLAEIVAVITLVGIGFLLISVIATIVGLLPAIAAAVVIYLLFHSLLYAAIAFVIVAFLWAVVKRH